MAFLFPNKCLQRFICEHFFLSVWEPPHNIFCVWGQNKSSYIFKKNCRGGGGGGEGRRESLKFAMYQKRTKVVCDTLQKSTLLKPECEAKKTFFCCSSIYIYSFIIMKWPERISGKENQRAELIIGVNKLPKRLIHTHTHTHTRNIFFFIYIMMETDF